MKLSLLVLAVLLALVFGTRPLRAAPLINDITTTPEDPPQFRKLAELQKNRDLSYPAAFAPIQKKAYPDVAPLKLLLTPDQAFAKVRETAASMPRWTIVSDNPKAHVLEAVVTSRLMRFKDDVVVEVRPAGFVSMVHMRSKSRVGKGDLGVNAARIRQFLSRLSQTPQPR